MFEFNLNSNEYKNIHFIGIGGVSMSGIAHLLLKKGFNITGSDRQRNHFVRRLENAGADIKIGQRKENINNPDLVIYTDAILDDNEELIAAREIGVPCVSRGIMLGAVMRNYEKSIAVSGTHGKSTATSMIAEVLLEAKADPTILLGGDFDNIGGNSLIGKSDFFLTEACEYKGNILYYFPQIAIVLNCNLDHVDFFKTQENFTEYFKRYMENLNEDGLAILNTDDSQTEYLIPHVKGRVVTFGIDNEAHYRALNLRMNKNNGFTFEVAFDREVHTIELNVLGKFNVYDALAAFVACHQADIDIDKIINGLSRYQNLRRRQEILGEVNGAVIMTDYGHHPKEIRSTLEALKFRKDKRIICVFQPHTYSRTKELMDDFAESFYDADLTIVTDIYAAREKFDPTVHSTQLVAKMKEKGLPVEYIGDFDAAKDYLLDIAREGDLIVTTGCGNPDVLARMLFMDKESAYAAY